MYIIERFSKLQEFVLPFYAKNDTAHQIQHALHVVDETVVICDKINASPETTYAAITAAYLHDISCHVDRDTHHELAKYYVLMNWDTILPLLPSEYYIDMHDVANACAEHRSSFTGAYSSIVSQIVSAADNGKPSTDHWRYHYRAFTFAIEHKGYTHQDACHHALTHIIEKYGHNGYNRVSDVYAKVYANEIEELACWAESMTMRDINALYPLWLERYNSRK